MSIDAHRDTRRLPSIRPCRPIEHAITAAGSGLVEPTSGQADLLTHAGRHLCSKGAHA